MKLRRNTFSRFVWGLLFVSGAFCTSAYAQTDFSDAPSSYGSAGHALSSTLYMGECVDDEPAAQFDVNANGDDTGPNATTVHGTCSDASPFPPNPFDDDEDILELFTITDGQSLPQFDANIINTTGNPATIKCWIDYNGNGVFENTALESPASATVTTSSSTATILFSNVPATTNATTGGVTFMRCRVASNAADVANPTGNAANGEVEDYRVIVYEQISVCPAGTVQVPFQWENFNTVLPSPATGWVAPNGVTNSEVGTQQAVANLNYSDSLGNAKTMTATADIIDPNEMNCDGDIYNQGGGTAGHGPWNAVSAGGQLRSPWASDFNTCTANGTRVNAGRFEFRMNSETSAEDVTLRISTSTPVYITNYTAADIDYVGLTSGVTFPPGGPNNYEAPGNSFQDEVFFSANLDGEDVPLNLTYGQRIQPNGLQGGAGYGNLPTSPFVPGYFPDVNGNLSPTDPRGHITVQPTVGRPFNQFNFTYSNGVDDGTAEADTTSYQWWAATRGRTFGASDGHLVIVEAFEFCAVDVVDYGDAIDPNPGSVPGNYNTQSNDLGPSHTIRSGGFYLGNCVDGDNGTAQNAAATADDTTGPNLAGEILGTCTGNDDEDGVTLPTTAVVGTSISIPVSAGGADSVGNEVLNAWIDYNYDGVFDSSEQIATNLSIAPGSSTTLTPTIPATATPATTYARFRYATQDAGGENPFGPADDGEVEDYQITLQAPVTTGTIVIVKNTIPDSPQDFSFTTTGGLTPATFDLDDDADATLSNTQTYSDVDAGAYTVTETATPGYTTTLSCVDPDGGTTTSGATATIDLDSGETVTCTFTNTELVSIGNVVWMDNGAGGGTANDGIKQAGEQGVANVDIELHPSTETNPDTATPVASTQTAADGSYILSAPPGQYFVYIPPSEFTAGQPLEEKISSTGQDVVDRDDNLSGSDDGDDTEADGVSSPVYDLQPGAEPTNETVTGFNGTTLSPSRDESTNSTADFAFYEPVSIGNVVWMDNGAGGGTANDGIKQSGEQGVANVDIELHPSTETNPDTATPVASTQTAADGSYILSAPPGQYFVYIPPSEFTTGQPLEEKISSTGQDVVDRDDNLSGSDDGDDTESDGVSSPVYDLQPGAEPTAEAGFNGTTVSPSRDESTNSTADFAFYAPVSIGNLVWMDNGAAGGTPNDGIKQTGESGVEGVVVELHASTAANPDTATPLTSVITLADGSYMFNDLVPGSYLIHIPSEEFAQGEPLEDKVSTNGQAATDNVEDDNLSEDGDDNESDGVTSPVISVLGDDEPTLEAGFPGAALSTQDDNNTNSTVDFGFLVPVSIGSFVWEDTNGDGIQDQLEPPIAGSVLQLQVDNGSGSFVAAVDIEGNAVSSATTGADGIYAFINLPPNDYKVVLTPPAGYFASPVQSNSDDNIENDSNIALEVSGNFESPVIELASGGELQETDALRGDNQDSMTAGDPADLSGNMTVDFGLVIPATIGNYVWLDLDKDGVQDANEDGIPNVTVNLFEDSDGNGVVDGSELTTPVATKVTGPNGEYLFPGLEPGVVYITQVDDSTLPAGLIQTYDEGPTPGSVGTLDHTSDPITLDPGEEHLTADFGYAAPDGSIGDTIWVDANDDGVQNPGEPGIPGVTVSLTPAPDVDLGNGPGNPITVVTDVNGKYLFSGLPISGVYVVEVNIATLPTGYVAAPSGLGDPDVRDGNSTTNDNQTTINLTSSDPVNLDADFGYLPPAEQNNTVGDTIWIDVNENGQGPAGTPGGSESEATVPGVTVSLTNTGTNAVIGTTITDANGQYLFTGIPDGSYRVSVTDQNNVLDGLTPTYDDDGIATPNFSLVDLDSAGVISTSVANLDQDFGYVDPNNTRGSGSIGDTIFFDQNGSNTFDPGEGIEGVTVRLYGPGPDGDITTTADNVLLAATVTDENGKYLFTGLDTSDTGPLPGTDYQVVVDTSTLPNGGSGWINTVDPDTPNPGDSMSITTLTDSNSEDLEQDFGYIGQHSNSLSGTVWSDTDGDGEQTESGVFGGVTIELRDQQGNVLQTTKTDVNGNYEFTNLPDGIYVVVVTDDDNVLNGYEHTDSPHGPTDTSDETSKDDTGYTVDLDSLGLSNSPVTNETGDFGYKPIVTNPISLSWFLAQGSLNNDVAFRWQTQTEVNNLGFNLYAQVKDEWVKLNDELVVAQGDSVTVQEYQLVIRTTARVFALSDVDAFGNETLHGPFELNRARGVQSTGRPIDWQFDAPTREAKKVERERQRKQQLKQRSFERLQKRATLGYQEGVDMLKKSLRGVASLTLAMLIPNAHANGVEDVLNMQVKDTGIYEVTHNQLATYGLDLSGEPISNIGLSSKGQSIPIQVIGSTSDNGVFGPGASIRFVGEGIDTLYTDTNVYTLRLGTAAAISMAATSPAIPTSPATASYLATRKYAPQNRYSFSSPNEQDPWYAEKMVGVNKATQTQVTIELDEYVPGGNAGGTKARLNVDVWGASDLPGNQPDHHMLVDFNGAQVMNKQFSGFSEQQYNVSLENVRNGNNIVKLTLPVDLGHNYDAVIVNEVTVSYPRKFRADGQRLNFPSDGTKFDVRGLNPANLDSDPGTSDSDNLIVMRKDAQGTAVIEEKRVQCNSSTCRLQFAGTGQAANYYVSFENSLLQPELQALPLAQDISSNQAQYLIISHPDFINVQTTSTNLGLLEDLAVILSAEFSSVDIVDVEAIYAQFGHHIFNPESIRDYIQYAVANRGTQQVLLVGGDIYDYRNFTQQNAMSFIPSLYAATGNGISFSPVDAKYVDLDNDNVPDIPIARLPVRTESELDVLLQKRNAYVNRDYTGKAVFAADGFDNIQQYDFKADAESVADDYFNNWSVGKAYVDDDGVQLARTKLINQINAGVTLTAFFGHSSTNQWSFSGLFNGNDAAGLNNTGKPTIVTQWGCWNTYYVSPNEDSMGHRFMMEGDKGAVAVMGASTLTDANAEKRLARLVFERLSQGESLGTAVVNAKREYAESNPNDLDVLLGWTLLGLPELRLN